MMRGLKSPHYRLEGSAATSVAANRAQEVARQLQLPRIAYSVRNAATGFTLAARRAGR